MLISIASENAAVSGQPTARPLSYIPGFDGLRAIAVLCVLVSHAGYGNYVPGGFGVTVFFAISGYLITTLLLTEMGQTGGVNLKLFYARRILRLYPELIALTALCIVAGIFLPFEATLTEKLSGLFYYMNYYYVFGAHYIEPNTYPWRQLWSLAVEEHFYIFFPGLLVLCGKSRRPRVSLILFLIIAPFIWRLITYYAIGLPWQYNYVATETRIDSIAWGCLLAVLLRTADGTAIAPQSLWFVRPPLVPVALALIIFTLVFRDEGFRWTWRFTVQGVALALLIGNLLFDPSWQWVVRRLEFPAMQFVGRISYGLYLYHMLINRLILELYPALSHAALLALSLVLSLTVATLSYWTLEAPLKALRRKLGSTIS